MTARSVLKPSAVVSTIEKNLPVIVKGWFIWEMSARANGMEDVGIMDDQTFGCGRRGPGLGSVGIMVAGAALLLGLATPGAHGDSREDYWPSWRGPHDNGVATKGNPPITWSESENIKWKVKMPDSGESSPVIWGNKIFLQTAYPTEEQLPGSYDKEKYPTVSREGQRRSDKATVPWRYGLLCLDRQTGETLWDREVRREIPHARHHVTSSHSSHSAVTDGEYVWVSFGSRGLHCYDMDGEHQWSADLPQMDKYSEYGDAASPAIVGDNIVVVLDHLGDSKVSAFNKLTGKLSWEKDRGRGRSAWTTPLAVTVKGALQVIILGNFSMDSYDAATGDIVWTCSFRPSGAVPSPVAGLGNVYEMSGGPRSAMMAVELGRTGNLSDSDAIVWDIGKDVRTPFATSVPSPLLYDDKIYFVKYPKRSISCYNAVSGAPIYVEEKMDGMRGCYASPVGAAGRVYIPDRRGTVTVIKHSDTFEVLATNTLDEGFDASPAIVGDELYLRGEHHLYCIAKQ